jgi:hypothetical protein
MTFRGVELRHFDVRRDEAGVFTRAYLTADYSKPTMDEMGWRDLPGSVNQAKLAGRVNARSFTMTPNDKEMQKQEIRLSALELSDFAYHHQEPGADGESGKTEIRFILRTGDVEADFRLGAWMRKVGGAIAVLEVDHEEQGQLNLEEKEEKE